MVHRKMAADIAFPAAFLLFALCAGEAAAAPCRSETFEENDYVVCTFDPTSSDLRLFLDQADGAPYGTFDALAADLETRGLELEFAMNGGMYQDDFSPVGLHVEAGEVVAPANTRTAPADIRPVPNFYKKPNGVFYVGAEGAGVVTTERFLEEKPQADFATQSGPMLVIDGALHPAFIPGSSDRRQRDGVGMSGPTAVHFVISEDGVNFHDFARFFRDRLGCPSALFLDGGSAPGLYAPAIGRNDPPGHGGYGPIIAVVGKAAGNQ